MVKKMQGGNVDTNKLMNDVIKNLNNFTDAELDKLAAKIEFAIWERDYANQDD